jgi:hypothetical protein
MDIMMEHRWFGIPCGAVASMAQGTACIGKEQPDVDGTGGGRV